MHTQAAHLCRHVAKNKGFDGVEVEKLDRDNGMTGGSGAAYSALLE